MIDIVLDLDFRLKFESLSIYKFSTIHFEGLNSISNITNFSKYIQKHVRLVNLNQLSLIKYVNGDVEVKVIKIKILTFLIPYVV